MAVAKVFISRNYALFQSCPVDLIGFFLGPIRDSRALCLTPPYFRGPAIQTFSSRGRCSSALAAFRSLLCTTIECRCFPADTSTARQCGGRQRQLAEDTLRSTSNRRRPPHCLRSPRLKTQRQHFLFSTGRETLKPVNKPCRWTRQPRGYKRHCGAESIYDLTKPQRRRSSRCFLFSHSEGKTASGLRRSSEVGDSGRTNANRFWWESAHFRCGTSFCELNHAVRAS